MALSPETVEAVRQRAQIAEIVGETVSLRRQGGRLVGLCPFHDERTPSLSVNPERGLFYCFGCQAGGDVFAYVMKRDSLTFPEAVRALAERVHVTIREEEGRQDSLRDAGLRALEAAALFFEENLRGSAVATAYLAGRDISDETRGRFRLGYAPDAGQALYRHLRRKGVPDAVIQSAGLVAKGRDGNPLDRFRARLMFPIRDRQGRVTAFGGRLLDDRPGPKYLNSPDTPFFKKSALLYDLFLARKAWGRTKKGVLVEGYMDVLQLAQQGVEGVVASLGTALTADQVALLGREVDELLVAYDGDRAGRGAAMRGLWMLASSGVQARFVRLPEGEDPDSLVRRGGLPAWETAAGGAQRLVEFLTDEILRQIDTSTPKGKARAVGAILPGIRMLKSPVEQNEELRRLSQRLDIDEAALRREARLGSTSRRQGTEERVGTGVSLRHRIEMSIIKVLAADPDLVERILSSGVEFSLPGAKEVCRELAAGRDPSSLDDDGAKGLWARTHVEDLPASDPEELIKAWLREGKRERLKELREDIRRREARGENVPPELLLEVQALSREAS